MSIFFRPVVHNYEIPEEAEVNSVDIPRDISHDLLQQWRALYRAIGARKGGEAANLIILAQLTPSQLGGAQ